MRWTRKLRSLGWALWARYWFRIMQIFGQMIRSCVLSSTAHEIWISWRFFCSDDVRLVFSWILHISLYIPRLTWLSGLPGHSVCSPHVRWVTWFVRKKGRRTRAEVGNRRGKTLNEIGHQGACFANRNNWHFSMTFELKGRSDIYIILKLPFYKGVS